MHTGNAGSPLGFGQALLREARDEFRAMDAGQPAPVSGMTQVHFDAIHKAAATMGIDNKKSEYSFRPRQIIKLSVQLHARLPLTKRYFVLDYWRLANRRSIRSRGFALPKTLSRPPKSAIVLFGRVLSH
jgi:hypothetical protein